MYRSPTAVHGAKRSLIHEVDDEETDSTAISLAGVFLPLLYIAFDTAIVPLYADLQSVYGGGCAEIRYLQGRMAGYQAYPTLSSMGRKRLRPVTIESPYGACKELRVRKASARL